MAICFISLNLNFNKALAQTTDTTYATGSFEVIDIKKMSLIGNLLNMTMIPLNVQMTNPDTIYDNMAGSGGYLFNLPIFIDTTTGIGFQENKKLEARIIKTGSADINIFLQENIKKGNIEIYNMNGQKIKEKEFTGNNAYIKFPEASNGTYIYKITADNKTNTGKFIKINNNIEGKLSKPNNNTNNKTNARITTHTADYKIILEDPNKGPGTGYQTVDTTITLTEGNNGTINIWMKPVPPLTVDLRFHSWTIDGDTLPNAFVYIKDSQGNIDSLRTDSNGTATFENLPQHKTYTCGIGGIKNTKVWEGFQITIPTATNYNDTIIDKNYTLIPDSTFSGLNDTTVNLTSTDIWDISETYNIEMAINDTVRIHISNTFGATQQANLNKWADSLMAWTGIPIYKKPTPYPITANYNYLTAIHSTVGTNITPGTSNTYTNDYFMPTTGQSVIVNADMTTGGGSVNNFYKEMGRLIGLGEVTTGNSVMNPIPKQISDKDVARYTIIYKIAKAIYRTEKQDLTTMQYLRDNSTIIPDQ